MHLTFQFLEKTVRLHVILPDQDCTRFEFPPSSGTEGGTFPTHHKTVIIQAEDLVAYILDLRHSWPLLRKVLVKGALCTLEYTQTVLALCSPWNMNQRPSWEKNKTKKKGKRWQHAENGNGQFDSDDKPRVGWAFLPPPLLVHFKKKSKKIKIGRSNSFKC